MNELEAVIAIGVCLGVFMISLSGVVIYWLMELRKEQRAQHFKTQVLIDSVIEIFESKYKFYGEDEDDRTGISPGG